MITKLTPQQEKLIPEIRDKWLNKFYALKPLKKKKAKECIEYIYTRAGYKKPKVWFYDGSPFGMQVLINVINKTDVGKLGQNIEENIWQNICQNIWQNHEQNIRQNIEQNLGQKIRQNIWKNVWQNICQNIGHNICQNIGENHEQKIGQKIWQNICQNIEQNLGQNLGQNIDQDICQNVWQNIWQNIEQNIRDMGRYYTFEQYIRFDDIHWVAYYDYFQQAQLLNFEKNKDWLNFLSLMDCNIGATVQFDNICFVCSLPEKVNQNNENRLHDEHGMAIKWSDGWGLYALNGVIFPKDLYKKVISREMEVKDILAIEDIDQRVQALKFAKNGLRDWYKQENGKLMDKHVKLDAKGRPVQYELWQIPAGNTFNQEVNFMLYNCPSAIERGEKREYAKGVPVGCKTVPEAMSWGMSSDTHFLKPGDWKKLIPLEHES
jgi:hypothetical protein